MTLSYRGGNRRKLVSSFGKGVEGLEPRRLFTAAAPINPIIQENALPGTPPSAWYIQPGKADAAIQGFATDISVDRGQTISFKINDTAARPAYHLEIYRMGYYQGLGARLVARVDPTATQCVPRHQPDPIVDSKTGLSDCGDWAVSATWSVPADATSGVYFANIVMNDGSGKSRIPFVVRNDAGHSALLFQTSDATWEAYNHYGTPENILGGKSLYDDVGQATHADAVSYNRPFVEGDYAAAETINSFFFAEYPMVRFLEQNGYDVSYFTDVDTSRYGALLKNHRVFMSVGHDEYWTGDQRANVQSARDAGVNLAFFSGNQCFWKTRLESSIDGTATPDRTLVCRKVHDGVVADPYTNLSGTGMWRAVGLPENQLAGGLYTTNWYQTRVRGWNAAIQVPWTKAGLRFWRGTAVAALQPGQTYTSPAGYIGYEWNEDLDNGFRPAGLFDLSSTPLEVGGPFGPERGGGRLVDTKGWYEHAYASHALTFYRAASGSLVFDANTIQWSWALNSDTWGTGNSFHWYQQQSSVAPPVPVDPNFQQATVNLFDDMGVAPGSLQAGLALVGEPPAAAAPPTAAITWPAARQSIFGPVTITGAAAEPGGVVAAVEFSLDGGAHWRQAGGTASWTYTWAPHAAGTYQLVARAIDDAGNIGPNSPVVTITAAPNVRTVWSSAINAHATTDPSIPAQHAGVELGMRFTAAVNGFITGVRFWKLAGDPGTHSGELWDSAGHLLYTAPFRSESASSWQQVNFGDPVAIVAGQTYVVSYHTDAHVFADGGTPAVRPLGPSLLSPVVRSDMGVGWFAYDAPNATRFPSMVSAMARNYWVDPVFQPAAFGNGSFRGPVNPARR